MKELRTWERVAKSPEDKLDNEAVYPNKDYGFIAVNLKHPDRLKHKEEKKKAKKAKVKATKKAAYDFGYKRGFAAGKKIGEKRKKKVEKLETKKAVLLAQVKAIEKQIN